MENFIDYKQLQQFGSLDIIAKQVVEGFITGFHKSPFHGFSVEFAEHRLYNKGESTKHIDWKLYGRTDKMFVKRYEEETNLRCQIVLDHSGSMYFPHVEKFDKSKPSKIGFSVIAAASLIYMLKKQRDAFGLSTFSDELDQHTKAKSSTVHQHLLFSEMEKMLQTPDKNSRRSTAAADALHLIAESIHKRSLVIIFSDMFENSKTVDELISAIQHLKHNKHEAILFHVTDKKLEEDFEFSSRPHRFIDLENGEEVKINPNELKKQYLDKLKSYKERLIEKCNQYQVDFVEADINKGIDQILIPYLLKREKLY